MNVVGLLLAGPLLAAMQTTDAWVLEPVPPGKPVRAEPLLRDIMLAGHNEARAAFRVAPLEWDERLAGDAKRYAAELARTDVFQHSKGGRGVDPQGENLWAGTRLGYSYSEMMRHWLAEAGNFRPGVFPSVSVTGRFGDVAHYTQIVWPATRRFGCALASSNQLDYLVCRYTAPGNVVGRRLG